MKNVLLSIKPNFADKIFQGTKRYEFRRTIFKEESVGKVFVYVSAPVQKVVGEFSIDKILCKGLGELWDITRDYSGIDEEFFYKYFSNKNKGYAIKIGEFKRYEDPLDIKKDFGAAPPQSFVYV